MKLGLCTLAFRNDDVREVIRNAANIGFDQVEIFWKQLENKSDAELDEIRSIAQNSGIEISGIAPYFWLTNPELWKESMEIAERSSQAALRIGASMIRTFTDAGPTGIGSDVATQAHWEIAVESLKTITANAPELIFAVETHEKTLADTPASCERLLQAVDAPNLKVIFQAFGKDSPVEDFLRLEKHVRQVHLNPHIGPHSHADLEQCGIDYAALLRTLAEHNYPYSYAVEFCVPAEASWERVEKAFHWCRALTQK